MATKPASLPEWATDGGADIVEPLLAEKQIGWAESQQPPAGWFNWWMNLVYAWAVWLDAFESEVHTWAAAQTFEDAVVVNATFDLTGDGTYTGVQRFPNGLVLEDAAYGNTPDATPMFRTNTGPATESYRLISEYAPASVGGKLRTYIGADANTITTLNALWNDGAARWDVDDITSPSRRITTGRLVSLLVERYTAGGTDFINSAWVQEFSLGVAGAGSDPGVLDDDGNGIITRSEYKRYSSDGFGTALPIEANVEITTIPTQAPDYTRNFLGETIVSGWVTTNTTVDNAKIAELPVGYRPLRARTFPVIGFHNDAVWLVVDTNGWIKLMNDGSYVPTSLFGVHLGTIRFPADF